MAGQQFYQRPQFNKDQDNHQVYDDAPLAGSQQGQAASQDAQGTLDDIDSVLGDIASQEQNPGASSQTETPEASTNLRNVEQNFAAGGFKDEGSTNPSLVKRTGRFMGRHKRGFAIGGGFVGLGIGGVITMSTFLTGPLQTLHLAELLMKNNDASSSASENRLNKLFRYARVGNTGDIGETRVGIVGSKVFGSTIQQLKDVGIEFQRNDRTGNPKSMTIDTSKNPEFKGMSREAATDAIAEKFNLPRDSIVRISSGGGSKGVVGDKFAINTRDIGIKATRALSKNSLTFLEDGKIVSSIRFRALADFFNTPSLFHPLQKAQAAAENNLATKAERRAAEKKRAQDLEKATNGDAAAARAEMKDKISGVKESLSKALLVTAGMCMVRSIADDVVTVNRASIVVPAALQAVDKEAIGSQVQSGDDFASSQFDAVNESFVDNNGQSVFDARAIRALDGNQQGGPDIGNDYKQAFSNDTTAAIIKDTLGGGQAGDIACSTAGQILQGIAGIALVASGFFDGGLSWGAVAAKEGTQAAATAGAMYFIEHQATALLADSAIVPDIMSGPVGGNLMAYGAREAANTDMRAAGGIALTSSEELTYNQQADAERQQQFESKPFFARMFDTHDDRSALSRVALAIGPSTSTNINTLGGRIANTITSLPSLVADILPKAHAATAYDWGFPKYAIPESILNDTATEDPYANGDQVAAMLDTGTGQNYIDKAKACFGVTISKGSGVWDASPSNPVNPNSDEYEKANCDDRSDTMWQRVILFVFDTRTMKAAACYQGDDASCDYSGFGQASTNPNPSNPATLPSGSAKDIATELLPYIKSGKISCNGQASDCPDIQKTAAGQSIKGGACYVDALDPELLAIILAMAQKGHTFVLSAICSDHPSNSDSKHHYGKGVDFNIIDGVWMGEGGATTWTGSKLTAGQKLDQDIAGVAPKSTGFGQVQCHPTFSFLDGFTQFVDACHHQHVQVP